MRIIGVFLGAFLIFSIGALYGAGRARFPEAPHVSYVFMGNGQVADVSTPLEAITRGSLHGTEGGVGLLVKSLIIAIPTAIYFMFTKIRDWHSSGSQMHNLKEEHAVTAQAKIIVAHTKHALAISNWLKAQQQLKIDLEGCTTASLESLEEIWQRVYKNTIKSEQQQS